MTYNFIDPFKQGCGENRFGASYVSQHHPANFPSTLPSGPTSLLAPPTDSASADASRVLTAWERGEDAGRTSRNDISWIDES
jgi:hypothetical protein